jgi:hypothetical protein
MYRNVTSSQHAEGLCMEYLSYVWFCSTYILRNGVENINYFLQTEKKTRLFSPKPLFLSVLSSVL